MCLCVCVQKALKYSNHSYTHFFRSITVGLHKQNSRIWKKRENTCKINFHCATIQNAPITISIFLHVSTATAAAHLVFNVVGLLHTHESHSSTLRIVLFSARVNWKLKWWDCVESWPSGLCECVFVWGS